MSSGDSDTLVETSVPQASLRSEVALDQCAHGGFSGRAPPPTLGLVARKRGQLEQTRRRDRSCRGVAIRVGNRRIVEVPVGDSIFRHMGKPPVRCFGSRLQKGKVFAPLRTKRPAKHSPSLCAGPGTAVSYSFVRIAAEDRARCGVEGSRLANRSVGAEAKLDMPPGVLSRWCGI